MTPPDDGQLDDDPAILDDSIDGDVVDTDRVGSTDGWTELEIPEQLVGERIDKAISLLLDLPRTQLTAALRQGLVRLNGRPDTIKPALRLEPGSVVSYSLEEFFRSEAPQPDPSIELNVIFEDDDILVIDKPSGLVVHPGAGTHDSTLVNGLLARYPELATVGEPIRPGIVHRIDKGTSGLLMVARNETARTNLIAQLADHHARRQYVALVWGHVEAAEGVIDAPIGRSERHPLIFTVSPAGKWARTHYKVTSRYNRPSPMTMLELQLETGRTHQIRVHCAAIGHSVVGDAQYRGARGAFVIPRPFLHAAKLGFDHPRTGKPLVFEAPLPPDLREVASQLE